MRKLLKIFVLMVAVTISEAVNADELMNHSRGKRSVGGAKTSIKQVPYQVSIEVNGVQFCGGSIIAKHWIITAAHCMDESREFYRIRAGSLYSRFGGSLHTIRAVVKHPNFTVDENNNVHHDITLIDVNEPFKFDQFRQPIDLLNYGEITPIGSVGWVSGYTEPIGDQEFGYLETVFLIAIPKRICYQHYKNTVFLEQTQFCAYSLDNGKGPCQGDSGSGFVVNKRLYGMVSWGIGCGLQRFPEVFIKIAPYRHWIDHVIIPKYRDDFYSEFTNY